jgi:hypothetical protein
VAEQLTAEAVVRSMQAGNGRVAVLKSPEELIARLTEDGVEADKTALEPVLSQLITDGVVEFRQGIGIWLGNNTSTLWLSDEKPQPIGDPEGASWGPDGDSGPQLRLLRWG